MRVRLPRLEPEDRGRLIAYAVGVLWALVFASLTPSYYTGIVSRGPVLTWCCLMAVGCATAAIGTLTHRDVKVELAGIYLCLLGTSFYLVAQIGFAAESGFQSQTFMDRVPALLFIGWHMTLLLPRLFGLESFRRSARRAARAAEVLRKAGI